MRNFIRNSLLNCFSLYAVAAFYPGLLIPDNLLRLVYSGAVFTLINLLVKPIIKLFLLPINLITIGLFRWLANVIILFILVRILPDISLTEFTTSAVSQAGFVIPGFQINLLFSHILASFLLSLIFNLFDNILVEE